jgi:co-chaperonin GroES (HSP10)
LSNYTSLDNSISRKYLIRKLISIVYSLVLDKIKLDNMSKLLPLGEKILVLPDPPATHRNGFEIPEGYREPASEGVVVSLPKTNHSEAGLKPGDRVFFHNNSGVPVEREGTRYIFMKEVEIYGTEEFEEKEVEDVH